MPPILTVIPSLRAARTADGRLGLTHKFVSGSESYASRWPGTVTVLLASGPSGDNLDNDAWEAAELPFRAVLDGDLRAEIARSSVVLATAGRDQAHIAALCAALGVPLAYVTEYSLRTRLQIVRANTDNPLLRLRRSFWEYRTERMMQRAIRRCAGVQCNGTPTFDAYRRMTPRPLLFFDTRTTRASLITDEALAERLEAMEAGGPLRLVFSGRLIRMKGADHLVEVARHLVRLGLSFKMTLCGDGDLSESIREAATGLPIEFAGVLDFTAELQPLFKASADLFVCCHRQGDPSCTYLETMAAGVPIIGYDNEAFLGLQAASGVGWLVAMDDPEAMAERIASLDRTEIADASRRSLAFASGHTFESTFDARIEHLKALAGLPT